MAKLQEKTELKFRPAKPSDASLASKLLYEAFPKKANFIIGLGSKDRAQKILKNLFEVPGHRLSYEFTQVALLNNHIAGMMIAFPGERKGKLSRHMAQKILKNYGLRGKTALLLRSWPLMFIKESSRDEYFLCVISVKKRYRKLGIGKAMLNLVESQAQKAGFSKIALIVHLDNQIAKQFYDHHGYAVESITLESNSRVPYLGTGYQRRVKQFQN